MKMNKNLKISIRIITLFTIAMFMSFIPELAPNFFGDWHCQGRIIASTNIHGYPVYSGCDMFEGCGVHNPEWHFGYRHYLFFFMGFCLTIVQVVKIISIIGKEE
jgi:hypothetical protein